MENYKNKIRQQRIIWHILYTQKKQKSRRHWRNGTTWYWVDPNEDHSYSVLRQILTQCSCLPNIYIYRENYLKLPFLYTTLQKTTFYNFFCKKLPFIIVFFAKDYHLTFFKGLTVYLNGWPSRDLHVIFWGL